MSDFLRAFDEACAAARIYGDCEWIWKSWTDDNGKYNLVPVARTMHPSFMGGSVPKWDPERDQFSRMLRQAV